MPLRASSGTSSGASLAAAASAATASATDLAHGHYGVAGEGRGAGGGDRGEVGDQTPRLRPAALGTLGQIVGRAHRAHQLEPLLAIGALVLVKGHDSHLSVSGRYPALILLLTEGYGLL